MSRGKAVECRLMEDLTLVKSISYKEIIEVDSSEITSLDIFLSVFCAVVVLILSAMVYETSIN